MIPTLETERLRLRPWRDDDLDAFSVFTADRKATEFVGGTFYRQMLGEMQKSVGKPAFMHGGQAEETFRSELNSHLADKMAESSAHDFTGSMFELFQLQRS